MNNTANNYQQEKNTDLLNRNNLMGEKFIALGFNILKKINSTESIKIEDYIELKVPSFRNIGTYVDDYKVNGDLSGLKEKQIVLEKELKDKTDEASEFKKRIGWVGSSELNQIGMLFLAIGKEIVELETQILQIISQIKELREGENTPSRGKGEVSQGMVFIEEGLDLFNDINDEKLEKQYTEYSLNEVPDLDEIYQKIKVRGTELETGVELKVLEIELKKMKPIASTLIRESYFLLEDDIDKKRKLGIKLVEIGKNIIGLETQILEVHYIIQVLKDKEEETKIRQSLSSKHIYPKD